MSAGDAQQPRGGVQDLDSLVEALARGESMEGIPTEDGSPLDAELDRRESKFIKSIDGGGCSAEVG